MQNNLQYVCKPSVSGGYKVTVKPYNAQQDIEERLVLVAEMCILNKLADDYSVALSNIPCVKERFNMYAKSSRWRFNDVRRKMCRVTGNKTLFEKFESDICEIIDNDEMNIEWLENTIKSQLVGKIEWQYIDAVMLSGILSGLIDILMVLNYRLYGKYGDEYAKIKEDIDVIEKAFGDKLLNKGSHPDLTNVGDALESFFKNIKQKSEEFVKKSKKERELSCLKETKTA